MDLPLDAHLTLGIEALHRPPPPGTKVWTPRIADLRANVERIDRCGYDTVWAGDHLALHVPMLDPMTMLAQAAGMSSRLTFGVGVYLVPLRHPAAIARQVSTLDLLTEGRLIFGVGVGGEFPKEYELAGVPLNERGARLGEGIQVLRKLWTGEPVSHEGRFWRFADVAQIPPPRQPGGPPIWSAGRADAALRRIGRLADGWHAYVVTPQMYAEGLQKIAAAADQAKRKIDRFGTGHLIFACLDETYEKALDAASTWLSARYNMDFRRATQRYAALGTAQQVAERLVEFYDAGVRHICLAFVGPYDDFDNQTERFAAEVMPLLKHLRRAA